MISPNLSLVLVSVVSIFVCHKQHLLAELGHTITLGLEQTRVVDISDGLGFIPKDDPETCRHNFDQPRKGWLYRFGTPKDII